MRPDSKSALARGLTAKARTEAQADIASDAPLVSVVIATRNRASQLQRILDSVEAARGAVTADTEVVIVDNGSTDGTAALLEQWSAAGPGHIRVRVERPGKSRALNAALAIARGALLVFTDDDVEVPPDWLQVVMTFFAEHPHYAAAMGRVAVPPDIRDSETLARVRRYRGAVPLFDMGNAVCDAEDMYGCNMVVRRAVLEQVGMFNESLGPGASGLHDDIDLARRIRQAGMRIGYMPNAVVYHEVDLARLTDAYYRDFQVRLGRSGFEMDPNASYWRSVRRLLESAVVLVWWSVLGVSSRRTRAWGRVIRHADLIRWGWRRTRERRALGR